MSLFTWLTYYIRSSTINLIKIMFWKQKLFVLDTCRNFTLFANYFLPISYFCIEQLVRWNYKANNESKIAKTKYRSNLSFFWLIKTWNLKRMIPLSCYPHSKSQRKLNHFFYAIANKNLALFTLSVDKEKILLITRQIPISIL